MGCVPSKQAVSVTPASLDHSGGFNAGSGRSRVGSCGGDGGGLMVELELNLKKVKKREASESGSERGDSGGVSSNGGGGSGSVSFRLGNLHKYVEREQVAAGWPAWLSAVAGEAIHGWVPLRADSFEKLERVRGLINRITNIATSVDKIFAGFSRLVVASIGQGTYSTVFRARELETGNIFALKKVKFDSFEPESVRFMAREIMILRRLNHPNIMKLEGLVTSRSSCNIYLVFQYMEHDISGLISSPEITFSEAQVKCYMKQLLSALDHCHSRGVMHRDIKGANLLVDNEGVLKVADFGLANFSTYGQKQPLTSHVVTLWYRPPELLLGSTDYGVSVDLWSVGCLLAELLTGRPILQGRTEVEQLHKIFKLCGSPPEDYWKKSKLPHATLFKPHHPYKSTLWETLKDQPEVAVQLVESLLYVEPNKRATAASALASEYFKRQPCACDPSSLPKYPPSKEINIKQHEETARKKPGGRSRAHDSRKPARKQNGISKLTPEENLPLQMQADSIPDGTGVSNRKEDIFSVQKPRKLSMEGLIEASHPENASKGDEIYSGPLQVSASSGFAWVKRRPTDSSLRSRSKSSSRSLNFGFSGSLHLKRDSEGDDKFQVVNGNSANMMNSNETKIKHSLLKQWSELEQPNSFNSWDGYHSQELSAGLYCRDEAASKRDSRVYDDQGEKVELSGSLLSQTSRIDELMEKHDRHIGQAVKRSWFRKVTRNVK